MLRSIVRASIVAGIVLGAANAFAFSTGPPLSRTGAPAFGGKPAEGLCTLCHNLNPANMPNGKVEILDLPNSYTPGQSYPIRVRVTSTANESYPERKWGFQITAAYLSNGLGAGTWSLPTSPPENALLKSTYATTSTHQLKTRVYISHLSSSSRPGWPSPSEWTFSWVAPPVDSGTVIFFAAGNAANGDGAAPGTDDQIYTTRDTVLTPAVVGVPYPASRDPNVTALEPLNPNPMTLTCVDVSYTIARAGNVEVALFDAQGRRVRTLVRGWREAGPGFCFWDGKREDGSRAPNGVYFVRLRAPGETRVFSRRLVLAR